MPYLFPARWTSVLLAPPFFEGGEKESLVPLSFVYLPPGMC